MVIDFLSAIPVLPVLNIEQALAFYTLRLGFRVVVELDDYAGVERGPIQIHFWLCSDSRIPANTSCRINVKGIDALYSNYNGQGVIHPNGELSDKPWGIREFTVIDTFGNALVFGEETN